MDIRTGDIYPNEKAILEKLQTEFVRPMIIPPTPLQLQNMKVGRNDPCPCGSGKKFKECCLLPRLAAAHLDAINAAGLERKEKA